MQTTKQDPTSPRIWLVDAAVSIASLIGLALAPVLALLSFLAGFWFLIFWLTIAKALASYL